MDYLTLGELDREVSTEVSVHGATAEFAKLWKRYLEALNQHRPEKPTSFEATIPAEIRDAFTPVWNLYRKSYELTTGKSLPQLPA